MYFSDQGQALEERVGGTAKAQYVWSPVYVDALVLRNRDADGNQANGLEERFYAQQDANWNVTALVNASGSVAEQVVYDPYGAQTIYSPGYSTVRSVSAYSWRYGFQGMRLDTTSGLYESLGTRWYSVTLGNWTSPDPLGLTPDTNDYRMEGGNPVNNLDPEGTLSISVSISDITLRVVNRHTKQMLTPPGEINLGGKGELKKQIDGPPKPPAGKGQDLTPYVGKTAEAEVKATITNNGEDAASVTSELFFRR